MLASSPFSRWNKRSCAISALSLQLNRGATFADYATPPVPVLTVESALIFSSDTKHNEKKLSCANSVTTRSFGKESKLWTTAMSTAKNSASISIGARRKKKQVIVVHDFSIFFCRTMQRMWNSQVFGLDGIASFHWQSVDLCFSMCLLRSLVTNFVWFSLPTMHHMVNKMEELWIWVCVFSSQKGREQTKSCHWGGVFRLSLDVKA